MAVALYTERVPTAQSWLPPVEFRDAVQTGVPAKRADAVSTSTKTPS